MGDKSSIEWTDATWNPLRGCSRVSEGCRNCYAERVAARFSGPGQPYEGLARWKSRVSGLEYTNRGAAGDADPRWTGEVRLVEERLTDPLRWRKPRRIFANSMSDLFHEKVPDKWIDRIFAVMALSPTHTFQVLTKRPERMWQYLSDARERVIGRAWEMLGHFPNYEHRDVCNRAWPLPNVWLGVSVEDQTTAEKRVPLLLQTPAAVRFASYEPALGPIDFTDLVIERGAGSEVHFDALTCDVDEADDGPYLGRTLDWIIVGGESGPDARPFDVAWARRTVADCALAGVACFVKQLGAVPVDAGGSHRSLCVVSRDPRGGVDGACCDDGAAACSDAAALTVWDRLPLRDRKGGDPAEWTEDLRVRAFPQVRE